MNGAGTAAAGLVLASRSPRRLALLGQIGLLPERVISPDIDETPRDGELPRVYAERMAGAKLAAVEGGFVLAADTVVAAGRRILPQTEDIAAARACLRLLSGRRHKVITAVAARAPDGRRAMRTVVSEVAFARLEQARIEAYLAAGEWRGKAGGYAIQGSAAMFVRFISGSYSGVVGLPLFETAQLLRGLGFSLP